ncbi:tetratricopeptide repeat protein [Muribaculum caecicola]|uniref:Tetratricopeptide repeat protein n=1 Tax=Muribaculum caecicola TaxID=3038144 RepID=A0AC61S4A9_9BACT|nr:tetratricopeptide repeat protein [Muribaculum caecicola]THG46820.1 tetratricopeptide repeat protein [Muribaculum caecicola]
MYNKLQKTIIGLWAVLSVSAAAQVNSPAYDGYAARARGMNVTDNYQGSLDQLRIGGLDDDGWMAGGELLLKAYDELNMGRTSAARNCFERYMEVCPASVRRVEVRVALADCDFYDGAYEKALVGYDAVLSAALDNGLRQDMCYKIAYCQMMLGRDSEAASGFERLAGISSRYAGAARFYQGYLFYRRGDYVQAKRMFESVDRSTPPGRDACYYMAQIAYKEGDYQQALQQARDILSGGGQYMAEMNRIAGESEFNLGNTDEARRYLDEYMRLEPDMMPSAAYILGTMAYGRHDYAEAVRLLSPVTKKCDNAMGQSAYLYIGQSLLAQGDNSAAMLALEKASRMDYDNKARETAMYNYAVARMDGGRTPFGSSVALLETFLRQYPASQYAPKVQEYLVSGYMTDNNYDKALESINRIKRPSEPILAAKQQVLYELGARDLASKRVKQALARFEESQSLGRYNSRLATECDLWIGDCNYRLGEYAKASKALESYLRRGNPSGYNRMVAYYDLGYSRYGERRYNDARANFMKVAADSEAGAELRADAYNRIADCYYYASDFDSAAEYYDKALQENPSAGDYALFQKSLMRGLERDHNGKIGLLDEMMRRYPRSGLMPSALLEKADSQIALRQTAGALSTYERLVGSYGATQQGRQGRLQMAITLMSEGNRRKAVDTYKKVITNYPTSEEARVAADDLKRIYADEGRLDEYVRFIGSVPQAPKLEVEEADELTFQSAEKVYIQQGDTDRLARYVDNYPDGRYMPQALGYLSASAWENADKDKAMQYSRRLVDNYPDSEEAEDALAIKGNIELEHGDGESALATFRQLEKRASAGRNILAAQVGIMRVSRDMGNYKAMIEAADRILGSTLVSPAQKTEATYLRAYAQHQTGQSDKAVAAWESLAKNTDELYGAQSAYYLAQYEFDNGQLKKARRRIEKFIDANTPHQYWLARGYILLSDILRKQGSDFEADEYLKSLKENYPGDEADIFQMIDQRLK